MSLAADIQSLRDLILADLNSAHDYYTITKRVWGIVQSQIASGEKMRIRSPTTGTLTTEKELPARARFYISGYLTSSTFQQFVSLFEDFMFPLLRLWLLAFPQRLEKKVLPASIVLEAHDLQEVKEALVERELHELTYKKVRDWFAYLDSLVHLNHPTPEEIDRLTEIKASRDVLMHNRGVANALYENRAGELRRCRAGKRLPLPESYHRDSWGLIRKVVTEVSNAAIAKAPK